MRNHLVAAVVAADTNDTEPAFREECDLRVRFFHGYRTEQAVSGGQPALDIDVAKFDASLRNREVQAADDTVQRLLKRLIIAPEQVGYRLVTTSKMASIFSISRNMARHLPGLWIGHYRPSV